MPRAAAPPSHHSCLVRRPMRVILLDPMHTCIAVLQHKQTRHKSDFTAALEYLCS